MKAVNKLKISLIQSLEVAGMTHAVLSHIPFESLRLQLDNWHFSGFLLCWESAVVSWWPNRQLLQTPLWHPSTHMKTSSVAWMSSCRLGITIFSPSSSSSLPPSALSSQIEAEEAASFRLWVLLSGARGGNKLGLMQQLAAFCPLSNTAEAARCTIVMQKWNFSINQVDQFR